ncbi:MAG: DUF92 domain-containing protein [Candidatus Methanomethylophilaceae archaeon]|jgi:uncharacterized protein (TIGR00297 family)
MDPLIEITAAVILSFVLSAVAWKTGMLTGHGAVAAASVLLIIGILGGLDWLLMLVVFAAIGFIVTKIAFGKKKEKGVQEGKSGERGWKNIIGVALAPAIVSVLNFAIPDYHSLMSVVYLSTITVAASDTVASEIGVRDSRAWLITTFKRVPAGTNGGISVLGSAVSFAAAIVVSILGWMILFRDLSWLLLIPAFAGMIGNLLDSLFGATIEDRYISKYTNNFVTGLLGGLIAAVIYLQF